MVMDPGFTFEAWTLPNVAGQAFEKKFDISKALESYSLNLAGSASSDGVGAIDKEFDRLDELMLVDSDDHSNDIGSMVRIKRGTDYIKSMVLYELNKKWDSKAATYPMIFQGPEFLLDLTRIRRFDDPTNPSLDPDWEYGAPTIISPVGGETVKETQVMWRSAGMTSGTLDLVFQAQTTNPFAWDASSSVLKTELELLSTITEIDVSGSGSELDPYVFTFIDPSGDVPLLAVGTNNTDGNWSLSELAPGGSVDPRPWHRSYHPVTGVTHGVYQGFSVDTTTVYPGDDYSLKIDADASTTPTDFAGGQVIENVVGGRSYNAQIPVLSEGVAQTVRLVIRDMQENFIAASADIEIPADTWTWIPVPNPFVIQPNLTEVIYRVGIIEETNPAPVYLAIQQAQMFPGYYPETIGGIFWDLILALRLSPDDELEWVTPTWTDTHDSNGVPWDQTRYWKVTHKQTMLQLLEYVLKWGYRFSFDYHDASGEWRWGLYNPGTVGTAITGLSLKAKDSIDGSSHPIRYPKATFFDAEGSDGAWGEFEDATLISRWGKVQGHFKNDQGLDSTDLIDLSEELVETAKRGADATSMTFVNPEYLPFVDYFPDDSIEFDASPIGPKRVRTIPMITIRKGPQDPVPTYEVHGDAIVYGSGEAAMAANLRTLMRKVDAIELGAKKERTWDPAMFNVGASLGGTTIPWLVAANNAPQEWKDIAGYVCDGSDDQVEIQAALDTYRTAWLVPLGSYSVVAPDGGAAITIPQAGSLIGLGENKYSSSIEDGYAGPGYTLETVLIRLGLNSTLQGTQVYGFWPSLNAVQMQFASQIRDCYLDVWQEEEASAIHVVANECSIENTIVFARDSGVRTTASDRSYGIRCDVTGVERLKITNCRIQGGTYGLWMNDPSPRGYDLRIENCEFIGSGWDAILLDGSTNGQVGYFGSITNCRFPSWGVNAVAADKSAAIKIIGNGVKRTGMNDGGGAFGAHEPPMISDCSFETGFNWGLVVEDHAGVMISDCYMEGLYQAILLDNADECTIDNIRMHWCGDDNASLDLAFIRIENDSNFNMVRNCKFLNEQGNTVTHPDYGIEITTANCDDNVIVHNDLRNPGEAFVVAAILDLGTGTIFTMGGGTTNPGDNLT